MLQRQEAEERRDLSAAGGHVHRVLPISISCGLLEILGIRVARQILMRPGVRADRHAGRDHLLW